MPQRPTVSVIIPVLNEAESIQSVLQFLQSVPAESSIEVIVVDGGSQDRTVELAMAVGVKVLKAQGGRAMQMNAGARTATGKILLFLHADTRLPDRFIPLVQQTLAQPKTIAGAFELAIVGQERGLRWIEWTVKWRSRLFQLPYGDQAIFLKAETFAQLGGFAELPIMEDFELVRRLRPYGRITIVPASVLTSGRRWKTLGIVRTTLINQIVIVAYFLGVSPARIAAWYRSGMSKYQAPSMPPNQTTQ